jgi:cytochrome c peroxidase
LLIEREVGLHLIPNPWRLARLSAGIVAILSLQACSNGGAATEAGTAAPALSEMASLGEQIFEDRSLSASGNMACSTCHDPSHAFAGADAAPVPLGGVGFNLPGVRNAPSLQYLVFNPAFHFERDGTPVGGFDRDGRAATLAEQARRPLLSINEMANASPAEVVYKLSHATYAATFRQLFGAQIFSDDETALARALLAIQQYEREDSGEFAPFSSKYDSFLVGKAQLGAQELRGLQLFNDPARGNCAACHPSGRGNDGSAPLFTDFSYDNLGVPRNYSIPANADPDYYDLGLCGPQRTDLAERADLCGAFKVPTLRNITLTAPYFHNGRFQTLREAIGFYARRDTNPGEWYPLGSDGTLQKFDDLPASYHGNVNTTEVPYNRHLGDVPALSPADIEDIVAFLQTLTDGYNP